MYKPDHSLLNCSLGQLQYRPLVTTLDQMYLFNHLIHCDTPQGLENYEINQLTVDKLTHYAASSSSPFAPRVLSHIGGSGFSPVDLNMDDVDHNPGDVMRV